MKISSISKIIAATAVALFAVSLWPTSASAVEQNTAYTAQHKQVKKHHHSAKKAKPKHHKAKAKKKRATHHADY